MGKKGRNYKPVLLTSVDGGEQIVLESVQELADVLGVARVTVYARINGMWKDSDIVELYGKKWFIDLLFTGKSKE